MVFWVKQRQFWFPRFPVQKKDRGIETALLLIYTLAIALVCDLRGRVSCFSPYLNRARGLGGRKKSTQVREYATREKLVDPVWFNNQGWEKRLLIALFRGIFLTKNPPKPEPIS